MQKVNENNKEITAGELMEILEDVPNECVIKILKTPLQVASVTDELGYNITSAKYTKLHTPNGTNEVLQILW